MIKKGMPLLLLIAIMVLAISVSYAKKYSDPSGPGSGQGTSTIGTAGDYTTLYEAGWDFETTANTGNWTIEILESFSEASHVFFANTVGSNTVTIKPASTASNVTVTFTNTVAPAGHSGHLIIGVPNAGFAVGATQPIKTDNFTIDGSTTGGTDRNLTLINTPADGDFVRIVRVVGDSDNFTIKNCNVVNLKNAGGSSYFGLDFTTRTLSTFLSPLPYVPDNMKIINCYIESSSSAAAQGLQSGTFGTATAGYAQSGLLIENSTIIGRTRGMLINQNAGYIIRNNTIQFDQSGSGFDSFGILEFGSGLTEGWTKEIYNNKFDKMVHGITGAGAFGPNAISIGADTGTYNVYNNIIGGYSFIGAAPTDVNYKGIIAGAAATNYNVHHNSINMPNDLPTTADPVQVFGIGFTAATYTGTAVCSNNIVRMGEPGGAAIRVNNAGSVSSNFNDLFADTGAGAFTGLYTTSTATTLADWQTASGKDAGSQAVDPFATTPGVWTSASDLHFTTDPANPLTSVPPVGLVSTDIDGESRASYRWPGADERSNPVPVEISDFKIE